MLKAERPDLVVLTGDVIYAKPADKGMHTVLERVSAHNVPFVVTFGNHDDEQGMTRTQLYDIIRSVPGCLMPDRGEQASPDYTLTVAVVRRQGKPCGRTLFLRLPFLFQIEGCEGIRLADVRPGGELPPPERCVYGGQRGPTAACPVFLPHSAARIQPGCLQRRSYPDRYTHGKSLCTCPEYGYVHCRILLAYGRYTGGNTVYNHLPNGARVIVLKEGQRTFDTWIDLAGGQQVNRSTYPDSFVKK